MLLISAALVTLALSACGSQCMCACPPGDCPNVRTTATDNGKTVVIELGQWISLELPGPNADVTASSSDLSILQLVGKQRLLAGNNGKVDRVYMSFHAVKTGSAQLALGYIRCDAGSPAPCSYEINVRVVQFPNVKVTVWLNDSPTPTVELHVAESARFGGCCVYSVEQLPVTIDRPDVVRFVIEPFVDHASDVEAAITAVGPGTAHLQGHSCPQIAGSYCPSAWTLTVVIT